MFKKNENKLGSTQFGKIMFKLAYMAIRDMNLNDRQWHCIKKLVNFLNKVSLVFGVSYNHIR